MIHHAGGTYNGKPFTACYYHRPTPWDGLGCHTLAVQHLGYVIVGGVQYGGSIFGTWRGVGMWDSFYAHGGADSGIPLTLIRDAIYADIMSRYTTYGVIIFSDRVNRGLKHSSQGYPPFSRGGLLDKRETIYFSCATLAKWLATHPELGTLVAGPLMNNPNYKVESNWGVCQVFMWHAKPHMIWTDKSTQLIGPEVEIPAPVKQYSTVTYDDGEK